MENVFSYSIFLSWFSNSAQCTQNASHVLIAKPPWLRHASQGISFWQNQTLWWKFFMFFMYCLSFPTFLSYESQNMITIRLLSAPFLFLFTKLSEADNFQLKIGWTSRFGRFYCRAHFVQLTAPKCEGCNEPFRHSDYFLSFLDLLEYLRCPNPNPQQKFFSLFRL